MAEDMTFLPRSELLTLEEIIVVARQLVARGGAFAIRDTEDLVAALQKLQDPFAYQQASLAVQAYLAESRGATEQIMRYFATFT